MKRVPLVIQDCRNPELRAEGIRVFTTPGTSQKAQQQIVLKCILADSAEKNAAEEVERRLRTQVWTTWFAKRWVNGTPAPPPAASSSSSSPPS